MTRKITRHLNLLKGIWSNHATFRYHATFCFYWLPSSYKLHAYFHAFYEISKVRSKSRENHKAEYQHPALRAREAGRCFISRKKITNRQVLMKTEIATDYFHGNVREKNRYCLNALCNSRCLYDENFLMKLPNFNLYLS